MKNFFLNKKQLLLFVIILALAIGLPLIFRGMFVRNVLILTIIWTILGSGWNVLGGYCGQVSNGHSLFFGLGAYAVALLLQYCALTPWVAMWIGALFSMGVAYIIGRPLLRLKGHYFAIATMALAECMRIVCNNLEFTGGTLGVYLFKKKYSGWAYMQFTDALDYYYVFLAFALLVLGLVVFMSRRKTFYYFRMIKGNEDAAASVGIDVSKYKRIAYMMSAGIVSLGGSLYAQYMLYTDPSMTMTMTISMMIVLVTIMGGIGTVIGPVIGAVIMTFISQYSRIYLGQYGGLDYVIYGVLVVLIILFLPGGIITLPAKIRSRKARKEKKYE